MIHWKPIGEYVEPNWVKLGTELPPVLFWHPKKGATLGYIRDGELFDAKWVYVCDSNKVSNFSTVNGPGDNVIDLPASSSGQLTPRKTQTHPEDLTRRHAVEIRHIEFGLLRRDLHGA